MEVDLPSTPVDSADEVQVTAAAAKCSLLETPKSRGRILGSINYPPRRKLHDVYKKQTLSVPPWTELELKLLTEFIHRYTTVDDGEKWKNMKFWDQAGKYMQQFLYTFYVRSGRYI